MFLGKNQCLLWGESSCLKGKSFVYYVLSWKVRPLRKIEHHCGASSQVCFKEKSFIHLAMVAREGYNGKASIKCVKSVECFHF